MLRGTSIEAGYYSLLERYLVPVLVSTKLSANHVSILGLLVSLLAGIAFVYSPFWGGLLTLLSGLLDTLDGSLARTLGQDEEYGAFLDSVLDRYAELIIYLGIWGYFFRQGDITGVISLIVLLTLFGSLMVSYTRARAEGLGQSCLAGWFQRGERIIVIGAAGLLNPLVSLFIGSPEGPWMRNITMVVALLVLVLGTNMTALWRFLHVLGKLRC